MRGIIQVTRLLIFFYVVRKFNGFVYEIRKNYELKNPFIVLNNIINAKYFIQNTLVKINGIFYNVILHSQMCLM